MSAQFLDHAARAAFQRAVHAIESTSGVEVVIAVRRRSHHYHGANWVIGAITALAGLAMMMFSHHPFSHTAIVFDPFIVGLIAWGLVELMPDVKRWLTPAARRRTHVDRAARTTFVERGVHATASRAGLLVYISWLEQQVSLVADTALARVVPAETLAKLEQELTAAMGAGGARVAELLEARAAELGKALPRGHDDINELPDALDSDLERP